MGSGWHVAHLFAIGAWSGLVAGEMAMEVIACIVLTGTVLLFRVPGDALPWVQIACGAPAIGISFWCWR